MEKKKRKAKSIMRATTKDLALAAGVSLATVDRVLNGRPGVKQDTVERVNEAIQKLSFTRNIVAANLARGKFYTFLFMLPSSGDQFLAELIARIHEANLAFAADMIRLEVMEIPDAEPHRIASLLGALNPNQIDGVAIMAPESPQVRDAKTRLAERGIHTINFISGQDTDTQTAFVGTDNRAAGATAGRLMGRFAHQRSGSVLVIAESMQSRDSVERRLGFDAVINADFPSLTVLPSLETHSDPERTERIIRSSFVNHPTITGVYILSSEARAPLQVVTQISHLPKPIIIAHERTPFTKAALLADKTDTLITQDTGHLVRSALRVLRAKVDGREILASQEKIRIEILLKENV
jgi:LacI family transcriptional regulator